MGDFGVFQGVAYGLVVVLVVSSWIFWQKAARFSILYQEADTRLKSGAKGYDQLRSEYNQTMTKLSETETRVKSQGKLLEESAKKLKLSEVNAAKTIEDLSQKMSTLANQVEHWEQQVEALTGQLKEAIAEKQGLMKTHQAAFENRVAQKEKESTSGRQRAKDHEDKLNAEMRTLQTKLADKEKEYAKAHARAVKLEDILRTIDPEDMKQTKIKAHRLEKLYSSMKGLREMADERNQNWEVALRELSAYIVNQPDITKDKYKMGIGPLVAKALQIAGATLVVDEYSLLEDDVEDSLLVERHLSADSAGESAQS